MSELRLYPRGEAERDLEHCPWALLDADGRVARAGTTLAEAPRGMPCRLVIEARRVNVARVALPDLPARKLQALLANAVEGQSLEEAEQLHVVLAGRDAGGEARCALLNAAWLDRVLAALAARDLYPEAAVSEAFLIPWREGEWSVVVDEDQTLVRFDASHACVLDAGEPPAGLQLALAQPGRPRRVRVFRGNALHGADLDAWRAALGIDIEDGGKWDWRAAPWQEIGNLLVGRFAARRAGFDWRAARRPLLWGASAVLALHLGGMLVDASLLRAEQARLDQDMSALARRVLPPRANVVEPAWQVAEQLRALRAGQGQAAEAGMLGLLDRLGRIWPELGGPAWKALNYAEDGLEITLERLDPAWFERLRAQADNVGLTLSRVGDNALRVQGMAQGGAHGR